MPLVTSANTLSHWINIVLLNETDLTSNIVLTENNTSQLEKETILTENTLNNQVNITGGNGTELILFWGIGCPECAAEKEFLTGLQDEYPTLEIIMYEVNNNNTNLDLFILACDERGINPSQVPVTLIGNLSFSGFRDYEGELVYNNDRRAYAGYKNQFELAIKEMIGD